MVSTLRQDTSQRLEDWASYPRWVWNSVRHIAINEICGAMSRLDVLPLPRLRVLSHSAHHFQAYVFSSRFITRLPMNNHGTGFPHLSITSRATQKEPFSINQLTAGARKPFPTDHVREEGGSCSMVLHFPAVHLRDRVLRSSHMVDHV